MAVLRSAAFVRVLLVGDSQEPCRGSRTHGQLGQDDRRVMAQTEAQGWFAIFAGGR